MTFFKRPSASKKKGGPAHTSTATVAFDPASPTISLVEGGVVGSVAVAIITTAGGPVTSYAADTIVYSDGSDWATTAFGILPSGRYGVTVTLDPATLSAGQETATIPILLGNTSPGSQDLVVTVTVTPSQVGTLVASDKFLLDTAAETESPAPRTVQLSKIGNDGMLDGPVLGDGIYQPAGSWLTKDTTDNGDGTFTLTLTPDTSALAPGIYRHSFAVSDADCTNGVEVIYDVTIDDTPDVLLNASPSSLSFVAIVGGSDPNPQTVTLTNPGTAGLAGPTVTEGTGSTWLSASVPAGASDVYTSDVTVTTGALTEGTYSDTLEYTDANAAAASVPQIVAVNFTVQAASLPQRSTTASLTRLRGNSVPSSVRGWMGVPLPPGWLNPGDTSLFRIRTTGGTEIPIYVEALGGRHADGTLKSIYVEFVRTLVVGTPEAVVMECGVSRNTANDLTRVIPNDYWDVSKFPRDLNTSAWKTDTFPDAFINFPPSYLSTTQFWGSYDLRYEGEAGGPSWQQTYFTRWRAAADHHWNNWTSYSISGGVSSFYTQYDRSAHSFILWCLTGNDQYYRAGCAANIEWRNRYFLAPGSAKPGVPGGNIAIWEYCPWGMAFHYWLTGDAASRDQLPLQVMFHSNPTSVTTSVDDYESEPRPLAFVLYGLLACKATGATCPSGTWDQRITAWLNRWVPASVAHNGWVTSGPYVGGFWNRIMYQGCAALAGNPPPQILTQNFHIALLLCAFDQYFTFGDGALNSEIETRMDGLLTFMFTQVGVNTSGLTTHYYNNQSLGCGQAGHTLQGGQVNLNGLHANGFGTAGIWRANAAAQAHARVLLQTTTQGPAYPPGPTGDTGPYMYVSGRTYNETFHRAWEALAKLY